MIRRLTGAFVRAVLVLLMIVTPSMLLPGTSQDGAQIIALVGLFGAALTFFEYASTYPGLIEFRDAAPFNRIRFGSLFAMVFALSAVVASIPDPSAGMAWLASLGTLVGQGIDLPLSPVRLAPMMLPEDATAAEIATIRTITGLAYLITLLTLAGFIILQQLRGWPLRYGDFNVWINLPTFDPTAGGDVVERLERDARFNIALGFIVPFLLPAVVKAAGTLFGAVSLDHPQTLIWTVTAWAFLPGSLFMRGIAMIRIARMIKAKRRRTSAAAAAAAAAAGGLAYA